VFIATKARLPAMSNHHVLTTLKILSKPIWQQCQKRQTCRIGIFGGNFTGLPYDIQHAYLTEASRLLNENKIDGIRLSTRPDYISKEGIDLLKHHQVSCVELGAQSLDDEVLQLSNRGHTVKDVEKASSLVKEAGMQLVLQMMTGLPGDTLEKTMKTANKIQQLGACATRIYPSLGHQRYPAGTNDAGRQLSGSEPRRNYPQM
jgi:histone acetyltransferase (RNA polymerase elongator complex component)